MRSSIIRCIDRLTMRTVSSSGKKSKFLSLFYFLLVINLCTSSFNFNNNKDTNNHFTTHHPLRHHRHHALNRTHIITNHHHTGDTSITTRSPIESVRNFLSSREYDTKRNYYRVSSTKAPPLTTIRPYYIASQKSINTATLPQSPYQPIQRSHRNIEKYQKVKEKTFDDIIREISQFKKRKRFHKTSTSTTTTEPSFLEDDYDEYDDDELQDDEGVETFNHENGHLLPERQTSSERYVHTKKVRAGFL